MAGKLRYPKFEKAMTASRYNYSVRWQGRHALHMLEGCKKIEMYVKQNNTEGINLQKLISSSKIAYEVFN